MAMWRSLCSVAVAVAAVLAGLYVKSEADTRRECSQKPELTRHLEKYVAPGPKSALDPWPMKLGDLQRTSRSNFTATSKLRQPRWSFYWPSMHYNSPLVDRFGNIYAISTAGNAFSLDANGKFRWHFQVVPGACNPAFQDGVLFTFTNGVIFALDMETGQPRWVQKVAERGSSGNEGIAVGEGLVIAHYHIGSSGWTDEAAFVAVDVATGAEVWRTRVDSNYFNVIIAFADGGSSLVFTDMNGGSFKLDTHTGQHIWSAPGFPFPLTQQALWFDSARGAPRSHSALALVDQLRGIVYSGGNPTRSTGRVRALSLETGQELWERNVDKMLGNNGALAEIAGVPTLVLGSGVPCQHPIPESRPPFRGTVYGLHAETGRILWRFQTRPWNGNAAAGTVLNKRCPQANLPDAFNSPTIDGNGTVFIGWHGGVVYALDGRDGTLLSREVLGGIGHYESYSYKVVHDYGQWSVRRYQPAVSASVTKAAGSDDSIFMTLAGYIGVISTPENTSQQPVAMTVPVVNTAPEAIAMTVPVVNTNEQAAETMQFVLPSKYKTPADAPVPSNPKVTLHALPERDTAAMRWRGKCKNMEDAVPKYEALLKLAQEKGYKQTGPWELHRFNPPYTLPFLRTNEVVFPVESATS